MRYKRKRSQDLESDHESEVSAFFATSKLVKDDRHMVDSVRSMVLSFNWNDWNSRLKTDLDIKVANSELYGSRMYDSQAAKNEQKEVDQLRLRKKLTTSKKKTKPEPKLLLGSGLYFNPNKVEKRFIFPLPSNELVFEKRDFLIPWNIFCPSGKEPKVDSWRPMKRNRWSEGTEFLFRDFFHTTGECMCTAKCDEQCLNRIQLTECDPKCCPFGKEDCGNRAIQCLSNDLKEGKSFAKGFEIIKTKDKGYGLRSIRPYEPGELIIEYTGDVINADEVKRRLEEEYSGITNYYFLGLEKGLVIDSGTRGSAARFVNHSCDPNAVMEKWTVNGKPRMGLFAKKQIKSGVEFTYDYNFQWFSRATAQVCHCGTALCRGVIGERAIKPTKDSSNSTQRSTEDDSEKSPSLEDNDKSIADELDLQSEYFDTNFTMERDWDFTCINRPSIIRPLNISEAQGKLVPSSKTTHYSMHPRLPLPAEFSYKDFITRKLEVSHRRSIHIGIPSEKRTLQLYRGKGPSSSIFDSPGKGRICKQHSKSKLDSIKPYSRFGNRDRDISGLTSGFSIENRHSVLPNTQLKKAFASPASKLRTLASTIISKNYIGRSDAGTFIHDINGIPQESESCGLPV